MQWPSVINLLMLLATWAILGSVTVFAVPLLARVIMVNRVSSLRDSLVDATLDGTLPEEDKAVALFIRTTDVVISRPELFGLSEALAAARVNRELNIQTPSKPSYAELDAEQRWKMHDAEKILISSIRNYLLFGSRFWPLLLICSPITPLIRWAERKASPKLGTMNDPASTSVHVEPEDLARGVRYAATCRLEMQPTCPDSPTKKLAGAL